MLTLLLFLTQATAEWIEISQHHTTPRKIHPTVNPHETTKPNRIYINNSLPEQFYIWNEDGVYKVTKDVTLPTATTRLVTTETYKEPDNNKNDEEKPVIKDDRSIITKKPYNRIVYIKNKAENSFPNAISISQTQKVNAHKHIGHKDLDGPIEVLSLTELNYDEDDTSIETEEHFVSLSNIDKTKHLTAKLPTEFGLENVESNLGTSVSNHRVKEKVEEGKVDAQSTKLSEVIATTKSTLTHPNDFATTKKYSRKPVHIDNKEVYEDHHNTKVQQISSIKGITENIKDKQHENEVSQVFSPDTPSEENFTTEVNSFINSSMILHTNFVPIKQIKAPNPDEIMIKEILQDEQNPEEKFTVDNVRKVQLFGTTKNMIETVTKNTPPKYDVTLRMMTPNPGAIVKVNKKDIVYLNQLKYKNNKNNDAVNIDQYNTAVVKNGNNAEFISEDNNNNAAEHITTEQYFNERSSTEKELDGILNNDNIEIIREVHVTSTEEIPIRTTIKTKSDHIPVQHTKLTAGTDERKRNNSHLSLTKDTDELKPIFKTKGEKNATLEYHSKESTIRNDVVHNKKLENIEVLNRSNKNTVSSKPMTVKPDETTDDENKSDDDDTSRDEVKPDTNSKTMKNLIKFLKAVTETISRNTRRSFKGKISYLEELRDTIMADIEERIEQAFPDDSVRRGRSAPTGRGHSVEFPSSESALMTISFLTFAVFLIKLVLQILQAYKNKTMMMPAIMAAVGRSQHHRTEKI